MLLQKTFLLILLMLVFVLGFAVSSARRDVVVDVRSAQFEREHQNARAEAARPRVARTSSASPVRKDTVAPLDVTRTSVDAVPLTADRSAELDRAQSRIETLEAEVARLRGVLEQKDWTTESLRQTIRDHQLRFEWLYLAMIEQLWQDERAAEDPAELLDLMVRLVEVSGVGRVSCQRAENGIALEPGRAEDPGHLEASATARTETWLDGSVTLAEFDVSAVHVQFDLPDIPASERLPKLEYWVAGMLDVVLSEHLCWFELELEGNVPDHRSVSVEVSWDPCEGYWLYVTPVRGDEISGSCREVPRYDELRRQYEPQFCRAMDRLQRLLPFEASASR